MRVAKHNRLHGPLSALGLGHRVWIRLMDAAVEAWPIWADVQRPCELWLLARHPPPTAPGRRTIRRLSLILPIHLTPKGLFGRALIALPSSAMWLLPAAVIPSRWLKLRQGGVTSLSRGAIDRLIFTGRHIFVARIHP